MSELFYLNLPMLPAELEQELLHIADNTPDDIAGMEWIEKFHNNTIRAASHVYGKGDTMLEGKLAEEVKRIYGPYFNCEIISGLGIQKNVYNTGVVEHPPHCDRMRQTAINILLRTGGSNVLTCFYNNERKVFDLSQSENSTYDELILDKKICLPLHKWHAYNVQRYHSVENIEHSRVLFSLFLCDNPDLDTFKTKYPNLIIN